MADTLEALTNNLKQAIAIWATAPLSFESGQVKHGLKTMFASTSSSDALDAFITCIQSSTDQDEKAFLVIKIAPNFNRWVTSPLLMHEARDLHEQAIFADLQGLPWLNLFRQASEKAYNSDRLSPDDRTDERTSYVLSLLRTANAPNPKINY